MIPEPVDSCQTIFCDDSNQNIKQPEPDHNHIPVWHEVSFMSLMCMSQLLTQAGVSQTMVAALPIAEQFGVKSKPGEISWFSAAYSLTVGTFIMISGRLGDLYGYKLLFIMGYIWFGLFSLVCGFAGFTKSSVFFDVARALQGIGPAITMPNTQALIATYYPPGFRRDFNLALFGAVAPSGFMFGAIFLGLFSQFAWWPWTFWTCGIVSCMLGLLAISLVPKYIGKRQPGSFDWLGCLLGISGLILVNFAWNQGPNVGWIKAYVYVLFLIGVLMVAGFFYVELHVAKHPLIAPAAIRGETGLVLACIASGWSCFGVWLYYSFRVSFLVDGDNLLISAVKFIPCSVAGLVAAVGTALALRKMPSSLVMFMSMLAFFAGIAVGGLRPWGQTYWCQKFISFILQPFGMDMSFPAAIIILSSALPPAQQGVAGSLVSTVVNYSISIGLGVAGTVEYYSVKDLPESLETTKLGIRNAFYMGMGLAGCGVLVGLLFLILQIRGGRTQKKPVRD